LAFASALGAPLEQEDTLAAEHLYLVITCTGHIHPPEFVHRYSNRELELAITAALGAPLA
jgi:hypothetical protein